MKQVHDRLSVDQVKVLLRAYCQHTLDRDPVQELLGLGKTQFFALLKQYRCDAILPNVRLVTASVRPHPKAARTGKQPTLYRILTDRWDLSASEVIQPNLWRWQTELFFRWLKSHTP